MFTFTFILLTDGFVHSKSVIQLGVKDVQWPSVALTVVSTGTLNTYCCIFLLYINSIEPFPLVHQFL